MVLNDNPLADLGSFVAPGTVIEYYHQFFDNLSSLPLSPEDDPQMGHEYKEPDLDGGFHTAMEDTTDAISFYIKYYSKKSLYKIVDTMTQLTTANEKESYVLGILDQLNYHITQVIDDNDIESRIKKVIQTCIVNFATDIRNTYPTIPKLKRHTIFKQATVQSEGGDSILGFRFNTNKIQGLYNALLELKFFSDDEVTVDSFREIVCATSGDAITRPLKINCDNQCAAYIINKMKELVFDKLTSVAIERYNVFLTKTEIQFTAGSIDVSLHRFLENASKDAYKIKVDNTFAQFLLLITPPLSSPSL